MITQEQYKYLNSFRQIIDMFITQQVYVGGADSLFDYYVHNFNAGQPLTLSCSTCVSGVLLDCFNMIKEYERGL